MHMPMLETSCTHDISCTLSQPAVSESSNGDAPWPWLAPLPHEVFLGVLPPLAREQASCFLVSKLDTLLVFDPGILIFRSGLDVGLAPPDLVRSHDSSGPVSPRRVARPFSFQWSQDMWCSSASESVVCKSPHPHTDMRSSL